MADPAPEPTSVDSLTPLPTRDQFDEWLQREQVAVSPAARKFLADHRFLLPLLDEARLAVPRYFGPRASVSYELFHDPEDGVTTEIAITIHPTAGPEEGLRQLQRFLREWWRPRRPGAQGAALVTVQYL